MLRKLEKYEILDEIGHGGMATVYRARDTRLDRMVAVKIMHPHLRGAREARVRFSREARSVARLRHDNILEIYDNSDEDSDECYIAAELLTGPTLKEFAEAQAEIPAEFAACFSFEIAQALGAAHEAGIVHRDVKPENVLLHEDRCIKLTDFGIAQMVDAQSFTATGQILGSPGHMAPEQVEGKDCDPRTDVFSLGTVLYYLATGKLPFHGRNPHQILKRIMDGEYADPLRLRPAIGGKLRGIIVRALERDPAKRYPTAQAMADDLLVFLREVGIDEPKKALADYLGDPANAIARQKKRTIELLIKVGRAAAESRDLPAALDCYNRVLALDDGNATVLKLIERLGQRRRMRQLSYALGVGLAVFGVSAIAYAVVARQSHDERNPRPSQPGLAIAGHDDPDAGRDRRVTIAPTSRPEDAGGSAKIRVIPAGARLPLPAPRERGPRTVVFRPTPQNVSIAVDDGPPTPFGPAFHEVELEPGRHRFRIFGAADCCLDTDFSLTVPPGREPFVLARTLEFRPARLYVEANVPADVVVDDGAVRGRSRSIISVPLGRSVEETHRITVTAPGHQPFTTTVRLKANVVATVEADLAAIQSSTQAQAAGP